MADANAPVGYQQSLGAAGVPAEIHAGDRVYKVGHPTQRAKGRLEELVAQQARRDILRFGGSAADWLDRVEAGDYATLRPGWNRVMQSPAAGSLFLLSLLREHHPDATADDAARLDKAEPEQVRAALARVVPPFFELVLADVPLPPAEKADLIRSATAAMGLTVTT